MGSTRQLAIELKQDVTAGAGLQQIQKQLTDKSAKVLPDFVLLEMALSRVSLYIIIYRKD